jgi:D-lyxose ketol-isomerase
MLTTSEIDEAGARSTELLAEAGFALTDREKQAIEIADFGLSSLEETGLQVLVYVNTQRVCAKEIVMFPRQTCPEHKHPPFEGTPGKEETFRCRQGVVYLYTEGEPAAQPAVRAPEGTYTVWHETALHPGDQATVLPNTLHWFQAGDDGAILSEFSTQSRDDLDVFSDPRIRRDTQIAHSCPSSNQMT